MSGAQGGNIEVEEDEGCVCCGAPIVDTGTSDWYYCEECDSETCQCGSGVCVNCCDCDGDDE